MNIFGEHYVHGQVKTNVSHQVGSHDFKFVDLHSIY